MVGLADGFHTVSSKEMKNQKYIYYRGKSNGVLVDFKSLILDKDYSFEIWIPKLYQMTPKGLFIKVFFVWSIFHFLGIFKRPEYKIFLIYHKEREIVGYCAVLPKYFKTPFMGNNDLQVGPVGTKENHRRKGLAFYLISKIIEFYKNENITLWYVTRQENEPSARLIENVGFEKHGEGSKHKNFIGGLFDRFFIDKKL